ncbi:MAG: EAL domain-containing protein [Spirochaetia bacterium]|nr:EAL domain-containing protein [Spirochaetia bacterium]
MNNIFFYNNFDITAIIILVTIKLLMLSQRQIKNPTQQPFLIYVGVSITAATLNILSIYTLNHNNVSIKIAYLICNLFYFILELQILSVYLFYNQRFNMKRNLRIFYLSIPAITVYLLLFSNTKTNILYTINFDKSFTYGPLYFLLWGSGLLYMIDSISFLVKQKGLMQKRKVNLLIFCAFFLIATALIHYLIPKVQILQFTNAILILILFIENQNPLLSEDLATGALNNETFENYVLNQINNENNLLFIHIKNTNISNELSKYAFLPLAYSDLINKIKKTLKKSIIFRLDKDTFALTYNNNEDRLIAMNLCIDEFNNLKKTTPAAQPLRIIFGYTAPLSEFSDKNSLKNAIQWALIKMQKPDTKLDLYITPDDAIAFARHRIIDTEIHKIVNNKPIDFDLQPIFNLKTNTFDTAEALARINVPSIGYVPCNEFIAISEENGTIISIGKSMMEEICHVINTIKLPFDNISINISMIHFMENHIVEDFMKILNKNDINPSKIVLEITETTKAVNWDLLKSNMFELKKAGFTLSLDDFGTGYSSFESFLTLPFDIVKLDRNLLLACEKDIEKKNVLKTVVKMIKALDFEIILEGVENKEQDDIVREMGIDKIQGYYYSRPLNIENFLSFIKGL